jgi:GntR family transcriptional repressor for pyruvate dehydrogenase complex
VLKTIKTDKIYQIIMDEISSIIDESSLKSGDKLPSEREIAARLSVSRASVRQAISALVAKGVLIVKQGDGTYVADTMANNNKSLLEELSISLANQQISPVEIAEVRLFIECETSRQCAIRANEEICNRLKKIVAKYANYDSKKDSLFNMNQDLHFTIAEGAGNSVLEMMMKSVLELMNGNMWKWAKQQGAKNNEYSFEFHHNQHREIVEAIIRHDPEAASQAMYDHLVNIGEEMTMLFCDEKSRK